MIPQGKRVLKSVRGLRDRIARLALVLLWNGSRHLLFIAVNVLFSSRISCGTQHFICTDFPLFLPVLFFLHTGAHKGNGFLPEDGEPPPHLHILKADGSPVIVHPVNLHPPPVHRKLHPQGDIFRRVAYFQDFIGGAGAVFRVRAGNYGAFAVFQQFF